MLNTDIDETENPVHLGLKREQASQKGLPASIPGDPLGGHVARDSVVVITVGDLDQADVEDGDTAIGVALHPDLGELA